MSALSEALGQPVGIDDGDECVLEFDGAVEVVLAQTASAQVLSLRSAISEQGPHDLTLMQWALALNFTTMLPGCALAFDEVTQQLELVSLVDASHVSPDQFLSILDGFVTMIPQLRDQYDAFVRMPPGGYMGVFV